MQGRYEKLTNKKLDKKERDRWVDAITTLKVMPSMRALMTAGPALDKDNVAGFNCSYVAIDNVRTFDEIMYILMCGTGVGFSVERQYVDKLPEIAEKFHTTETVIKVRDSIKIGWATICLVNLLLCFMQDRYHNLICLLSDLQVLN